MTRLEDMASTTAASTATTTMITITTGFHQSISSISCYIAKLLYELRPSTSTAPSHQPVTVICISDTHNKTPQVPNGDILLHAGDLTRMGTFAEIQAQLHWINSLPHEHKFVVAGNHDFLLDAEYAARSRKSTEDKKEEDNDNDNDNDDTSAAALDWGSIVYLENRSATATVRGRQLKVFGSPLTPKSGNWAFQHAASQDVWRGAIPRDADIVLTHGPPKGHLDVYADVSRGCGWLLRELWSKRPRLVVFGHIHSGHGVQRLDWGYLQRLYDRVAMGEAGLFSVALMALFHLSGLAWYGSFSRDNRDTTILVNAAVVSGKGNIGNLPPTVIDI